LIPLIEVLAQRLGDNPLQFARRRPERRQVRPERGRLLVEDRAHHLDRIHAAKWRPARNHFIEHDAEAEDVGARVHGQSARLFGRHVMGRAHDHARGGSRRGDGATRR
jgi:hypothetical protein